jgi:putative hydrolase of the HAD superfamily
MSIIFIISTTYGYKNIIFDLGGVILEGDVKKFAAHMINNSLTEDTSLYGVTSCESWKNWDKGILNKDQLIIDLATRHHIDDIHRLFSFFMSLTRPFSEECLSIIKKLKESGYRIYMLSNFSNDMYKLFIENNDSLSSLFDGLVFSFQLGLAKPDIKFYQALLNQYKLIAEESIFIDDSEANVTAAVSLNIRGIVYKPGTLSEALKNLGVLE